MEKYVLKNASATGIVKWLNERYKKPNGKKFTRNDVTNYTLVTKHLPDYIGGNKIEKIENKYNSKSYNILSNGKDTD